MRGLYVHVPFCVKKCHYCNYVITANAPRAERELYFEALETEADEAAARYPGLKYDTLYLGGGTPSSLDAEEMSRLFGILRARFDLSAAQEVTCEVNPGEADRAKLEAYRALGVDRISLGVQSFDDALLTDMGRAHDVRAADEMLETLSGLGFDNVSLDLILRLPGQSLALAEKSLERAARSGAGQVVIYDLNVHAETVYGARQKKGQLHLPEEALHEEMALAAERILTGAGLRQYEVSSFAKPGFESRHNLIYWQNGEYLGLGPGAFSYMEGCRYQYASGVGRYLKKTAARDWSRDEADTLTPEQREIETLLTGLRLSEGFDMKRLRIINEAVRPELDSLESEGLVERASGRVALTRRGRRLAETVFTRLSSF